MVSRRIYSILAARYIHSRADLYALLSVFHEHVFYYCITLFMMLLLYAFVFLPPNHYSFWDNGHINCGNNTWHKWCDDAIHIVCIASRLFYWTYQRGPPAWGVCVQRLWLYFIFIMAYVLKNVKYKLSPISTSFAQGINCDNYYNYSRSDTNNVCM